MKKMILAVLLVLCLTACTAPAAEAPASGEYAPAATVPAKEFQDPGGQEMASDAYDAIMEAFGVGMIPDQPDYLSYPESFGEAYLEDNFLYICLTDNSEAVQDYYRSLVPEPGILRFVEVEHSAADLRALQDALAEIEGLDFSFLGVDVIENEVEIGVPDITKEEANRKLIEENLPADILERFAELPIRFEERGYASFTFTSSEEEHWDVVPMVMIDGVLYLGTGYTSDVKGRCGVMDGEIISQVEGWEQPTENDQSNFGTGYGYQYGSREGTVEVCMNGDWWIFATEEVRYEIQFP